MLKSLRTFVTLATVLVLLGCGQPPQVAQPAQLKKAVLETYGEYRVGDEELELRGLETWWFSPPRTKEGEKLVDAYLLGDHILMESNEKRLYGVDRTSGVPVLVAPLPYRCDFQGCEDSQMIYVSCRNIMVAVDKRGFVAYRKFLQFAPGGIAVTDETHVFVPCFDGRMRSYLKELGQEGYFDRQYSTGGNLEAKPALGTRYVYAGSNDGTLYALTVDRLDEAWSYKTNGPIRAGIVHDGRTVFVAGTDGNLYALNDMPQETPEAQLDWHRPYACGESIQKTPYVAKTMVLVVNRKGECHAVDRKTGRGLWVVPDVEKVLTQGRLNTYLQRGNTVILAVDNQTGVVRWKIDTRPGAFSFLLTNTQDDVIYLVKADGDTQAIREKKREEAAEPAAPPPPAP